MRRRAVSFGASLAAVLLLAAPAFAADKASPVEKASAVFKDANGKEVGRATLTPTPSGVLVSLDHTKHGMMNQEGPHAGDMPNLHVPADGKLQVEVLNPTVSLSGESALLDADGSALVIHAGADDYKTDPAGNAGARIACGVITP